MNRITTVFVTCLLALGTVLPSTAGMNQGGVLVVHHDPSVQYSSHCTGLTLPTQCSQLVKTASLSGPPVMWFIVAAFPNSVSSRLRGVSFGLGAYDADHVTLTEWGPCAEGLFTELNGPDWPDPGTGTAIAYNTAQSGKFIPIYWFIGYIDANTSVALAPHPIQGGYFGDDAVPPTLDPIAGYGAIGFGSVSGTNPCPTGGF